MSIYKFMTAEVAGLFFGNLSLRASAPQDFNDPFDAYPIPSTASREEIEAKANAWIPHLLESDAWTPETAKKYAMEWYEKEAREEQWDFDGIVRQYTYRIVCFTRSSRHPLLWTHYAKNHTGVMVEFDENASFFDGRLSSVVYLAERPVVTIEEMRIVANDMQNPSSPVPDFFKVKALEWAHEQEVRFFESIRTARDLTYSDNYWYLNIPPSTIKSVTFGLGFGFGVDNARGIAHGINQKITEIEAEQQRKIPLYVIRRSNMEYRLDKHPIKFEHLIAPLNH